MPLIRRFLIVDDNPGGRSLLTRTLLRKFPQSLATECGDAPTALHVAKTERIDAIVVHSAGEVSGLELIPQLRLVVPAAPIVFISGSDRRREAHEAGASAFLHYDAWLRLGSIVADILLSTAPEPAWPIAGEIAPAAGRSTPPS